MYIDADGTVRNQYFSKVPKSVCKETGMDFVMVAGKKVYAVELLLDLHTELEKESKNSRPMFKDKDPRNISLENIYWGSPKQEKVLQEIPEAGKVDRKKIATVKTEEDEQVPASVAEEMTKKEMVLDIFELNNAFSYGEVAKKVKQKYGTSVSSAYIASVKKEAGI